MAAPAQAGAAPSRPRGLLLPAFLLASLGAHALLLLWAGRVHPAEPVARKPVELVVVEVNKPPPPPPPKVDAPKPKPKVKPPPIRVAQAEKPPPPKDKAPPPPNEKPPEPAPKPPPLVVGLTMSSTTTAGGFAAPVGNTLYGKTDPTAQKPSDVKGYSAPRYVPSYQVDTAPVAIDEIRADYPEEVRREGIEGSVLLSVLIDNTGAVQQVKVVKGLDPRLDALAVSTLKKSRWKPAVVKGEQVSTEIKYNFRFELNQ